MPEPGLYYAVIKAGQLTQASNGSDQVAISIQVTNKAIMLEGESDSKWEKLADPIDRRMYWSFSGAAEAYTIDKLKQLGFKGNYRDMQFVETSCVVECSFHNYQGKDYERWDLPGGGMKELPEPSDDKIREYTSKWKAQNATPASKAAPPPPVPSDGSIPF